MMTTYYEFYALAFLIGLIQGGTQALSRVEFSRMVPKEAQDSYFGVYNLVGKVSAIGGLC